MGFHLSGESENVHDFAIKPLPRTSGEPRTFEIGPRRGLDPRPRQNLDNEVTSEIWKMSEARPRIEASSKPRSEASENLGSRPRLAAL